MNYFNADDDMDMNNDYNYGHYDSDNMQSSHADNRRIINQPVRPNVSLRRAVRPVKINDNQSVSSYNNANNNAGNAYENDNSKSYQANINSSNDSHMNQPLIYPQYVPNQHNYYDNMQYSQHASNNNVRRNSYSYSQPENTNMNTGLKPVIAGGGSVHSRMRNQWNDNNLYSNNNNVSTRKTGRIITMMLAFMLVCIFVLTVSIGANKVMNGINGNSIGNGSNTPNNITQTAITTYYNNDLTEWKAKRDYINATYSKYDEAADNGNIFTMTTSRDSNYINAYLTYISEQKASLTFEASVSSTDKTELVNKAKLSLDEFKKTEQAFVNGQPLGQNITITDSNGNTVVSDGTDAMSTPKVTNEMEAQVASFNPSLDSNGTYMQSATDIAGIMGLKVNYDFNKVTEYCNADGVDLTWAIMVYCPVTPNQVYVNTNHANYQYEVHDKAFISDVRHEMGHHAIDSRCGTSQPPIAGDKTEAVTSSYAVLFLGANRDDLSNANDLDAYKMTADTDNIAKQIHDGKCQ